MPLTLTFRGTPGVPIEAAGLTPAELAGKSTAELERLPLLVGRHQVPLAESFAVAGSADDGLVRLEGTVGNVHGLGAGMSEGTLRVVGDVGHRLGLSMRGGQIIVEGSAGDFAAAELQRGRVMIHGSVGDHLAAALPGSRRGMAGGLVVVHGSAGLHAAARLRRGSVVIGSDVGSGAAARLIAGSLLLLGQAAPPLGAGMRRGSIVCLAARPALLPTFRWACRYRPSFLRYYLTELRGWGLPCPDDWLASPADRYCGDLIGTGLGEILVRAD